MIKEYGLKILRLRQNGCQPYGCISLPRERRARGFAATGNTPLHQSTWYQILPQGSRRAEQEVWTV
jgi:hypothetical protein